MSAIRADLVLSAPIPVGILALFSSAGGKPGTDLIGFAAGHSAPLHPGSGPI